jgi:hypothetical protein
VSAAPVVRERFLEPQSHWMPAFAGMTEEAMGVIHFLKYQ